MPKAVADMVLTNSVARAVLTAAEPTTVLEVQCAEAVEVDVQHLTRCYPVWSFLFAKI